MIPFISRQDLGNKLNAGTLAGDDWALACVDAACDIVRDVARCRFNLIEDEEIALDGTDTDVLLLPDGPARAVMSVDLDATPLTIGTDWTLDTRRNLLFRTWPSVWTEGRGNVVVAYSHGYLPEEIPASVRMIALNLASRLYRQGDSVYKTMGSYSVRYAGQAGDLSPTEKMILERYSRVPVLDPVGAGDLS